MQSIDVFIEPCKELNVEAFESRYPHPVLLLDASSSRLDSTTDPGSWTLNRIVIGSRGSSQKEGQSTLEATTRVSGRSGLKGLYHVFPLVPSHPKAAQITVGCSGECDVQINDRSISRRHAVVHFQGGIYLIQDNDSSSGTMVNDSPLRPHQLHPLATGDRVTLGFVELLFLLSPDFYWLVRRLFID